MPTASNPSVLKVEVVKTPGLMGGLPCIAGTRVLAETIRQYLLDGYSAEQIYEDYPYLPIGAIDAVRAWIDRDGSDA